MGKGYTVSMPAPVQTVIGSVFDMTVEERVEVLVGILFSSSSRASRLADMRRLATQMISEAVAISVVKCRERHMALHEASPR